MKPRRLVASAVACFLAFASTVAQAQGPEAPSAGTEQSFSLEAALAAMRRAHPLLHAAGASIRVAEGNALTVGHWSNPLLDATYFQAVRNSSYDPVGTPAVGVTQFLEIAGAPAARRRSAHSEMLATQADKDAVERELDSNVREAFIRLAMSYERQRVRRDVVADLERASGIVRARVGSGIAPKYDASRIQLALEQAHADLADGDSATVRARGDLNVAVGPGASDLAGTPRFDVFDIPAAPALPEALDAARARRPDLVAAWHRTEAATTDIDVAKRSVFPGFALRLGVGYGQSTGQLDIGAGVIVPLPILERGHGTVLASEARAEGHRHVTEALTTAVSQRVEAAHQELVKRSEALSRFRSQTTTVSDAMRTEAEAGYREAKLSVLELVDAYHSLRDARLRVLELAEGAQVARVSLGHAIGTR